MMRELSLHILDIVQNSVAAAASEIQIIVVENTKEDILWFEITDNGHGMTPEVLASATDPFFTMRKTRKVGMGIPLLKACAEACEGQFVIQSNPDKGTKIKATFQHSHIDRPPLGDMAATMLTIILGSEDIDFLYTHRFNEKQIQVSTAEIKEILEGVPFHNPEVMQWLREFLTESEKSLLN